MSEVAPSRGRARPSRSGAGIASSAHSRPRVDPRALLAAPCPAPGLFGRRSDLARTGDAAGPDLHASFVTCPFGHPDRGPARARARTRARTRARGTGPDRADLRGRRDLRALPRRQRLRPDPRPERPPLRGHPRADALGPVGGQPRDAAGARPPAQEPDRRPLPLRGLQADGRAPGRRRLRGDEPRQQPRLRPARRGHARLAGDLARARHHPARRLATRAPDLPRRDHRARRLEDRLPGGDRPSCPSSRPANSSPSSAR